MLDQFRKMEAVSKVKFLLSYNRITLIKALLKRQPTQSSCSRSQKRKNSRKSCSVKWLLKATAVAQPSQPFQLSAKCPIFQPSSRCHTTCLRLRKKKSLHKTLQIAKLLLRKTIKPRKPQYSKQIHWQNSCKLHLISVMCNQGTKLPKLIIILKTRITRSVLVQRLSLLGTMQQCTNLFRSIRKQQLRLSTPRTTTLSAIVRSICFHRATTRYRHSWPRESLYIARMSSNSSAE